MADKQKSIVEGLVAKAMSAGADGLDIEYKDGYEEVCAMKGPIGFGIARFASSGADAKSLRGELYGMKKKRGRITADGCEYEVRVRTYDSFGEDAFHVEWRRSW